MAQDNQQQPPVETREPREQRSPLDVPPPQFELPTEIVLQVSLPPPARAHNLPVQLIFPSTIKNDVATLPKLTDAEGKVVFTRQDIIDTALTLQRLFPQDYGSLARGSTGQAIAVLMGPRDFDWVTRAYALHKDKSGAYPADFAETLEKGQARLKQLGVVEAQLQLLSDPGQYKIATRSDIGFEPAPSYEEQNYLFATEGKIKAKH